MLSHHHRSAVGVLLIRIYLMPVFVYLPLSFVAAMMLRTPFPVLSSASCRGRWSVGVRGSQVRPHPNCRRKIRWKGYVV